MLLEHLEELFPMFNDRKVWVGDFQVGYLHSGYEVAATLLSAMGSVAKGSL
jgi:hypothetical protein